MEQQDAFEFSDRRRDMDRGALLKLEESVGKGVDELPSRWGNH